MIADWIACREYLLPAIDTLHGTHTEDDIVAMLLAGRLRLWRGVDCALITEIVAFPRMKVMNTFLAGGDMQEIFAMKPLLEKAAKDAGCSRCVITGRKGWERMHSDYQFNSITLHKDL